MSQDATEQRSEMEVLKQQAAAENAKLEKRKRVIDVELAEIEPLVQEARRAVGSIKTESLSEIRALRAPPDVIRDILEGVLRLMGIFDTSWVSMKRSVQSVLDSRTTLAENYILGVCCKKSFMIIFIELYYY